MSGAGTGAVSPYVIATSNLGSSFLPHITKALLVTSIFSTGTLYCICATRSLYGLDLDVKAPRMLCKCTKNNPGFLFLNHDLFSILLLSSCV